MSETLSYLERPVLFIKRIDLVTDDKQWWDRFTNANIVVKIEAIDKEERVLAAQETPVSLGTFVTPYHRQPILEIKKTFKFSLDFFPLDMKKCNEWKVDIVLGNFKFNQGEILSCEVMDSLYIQERVEDWQRRVHDLIGLISDWTEAYDSIKILPLRKQKMHEGLMKTFEVPMAEIESVEIQKNSKTVMVFKPFGLWLIGSNGRVDLLTANGTYVLLDEAEVFEPPKWKLFAKNDKKQGVDFTQDAFYQLLEL